MRSEQEMLALILETAKSNDRIRAVMLNGSRVNPHAARDIFQDFDIVYFVTDLPSFTSDHTWIDRFGESAPGDVALANFGYTPENVAARARALLGEDNA